MTSTKPAKVAKTADGKDYIDLVSDSEDGRATVPHDGSGKDAKKTNPKIEILDLTD